VGALSVSVAMATFNGGAHLAEQLADLAEQSMLPAELVVCDDGSSDDTLATLEAFAISAPFPVHIHRNPKRLSYRANFIKCAGLCGSDLIAFCDQDDRWDSKKIATMVRCFDDPEVLLAFHDAEIVDEEERPLGRLMRARPVGRSAPLSGSPWAFSLGFTQVFRRWLCDCDSWWAQSADPNSADEPMAHDQWYFVLASALGTIVNIEAPLVRYRQHGANVFGWAKAKRTLGARLLAKIASATWLYQRRLHSAEQSAIILDQASSSLPKPYDRHAREGAVAYRKLADMCAKRAGIHAGRTIFDRARSFAALASAGGYGSDPRRFGARALVMDVVVGLSGITRKKKSRAAPVDTPTP
jgi:glycosyltransferase involved in cell wall biosynthesis